MIDPDASGRPTSGLKTARCLKTRGSLGGRYYDFPDWNVNAEVPKDVFTFALRYCTPSNPARSAVMARRG